MRWPAGLLCLLFGLLTAAAQAHDLGASEAFLREEPAGRFVLGAMVPAGLAPLFAPPLLPERCRIIGDPRDRAAGGDPRFVFECAGGSLIASDTLTLPWQREGIVLTATWANGTRASRFFGARGGVIVVDMASLQAGSGSLADAARRYTLLGIEHILFGIDHLLFVVALLLVVRGPWMLLKTITAFTLAHSLTLALATLGIVDVPPAPVEACIALSIVLVAAEGLRQTSQQERAMRRPWIVAFIFGLLHGFGFAGALSAIGLPASEVPTALLFFNVGVETGQIAFVATLLGAYHALRHWTAMLPRWAGAIPGYGIGTVAMLWFFERVVVMLG